ncbi:MAG: DegT/DnrJ/EryC1/StrS family aminotransferase [Verrucomicrobia bacterium]|nr:DegT/DnrJ/EryC1/StrS family aminotransferase [Verrucomicrobiota bacterium]
MAWRVPLAEIDFDDAETRAVLEVLHRKWLTMGPVTEQFEAAFAGALGVRHAVAVSSGTAALHLACLAVGVGPGDEVIVPSLTFVATANAVLYCGATPVFADLTSEDDWTISPSDIARKMTGKTAAIIVMHYGGYPCDMAAIEDVASRHDIPVIEDCAHAPLARLDGRALGAFGVAGCFSFYTNKNLAVGEGGMLVTHDDAIAEFARRARCHGMSSGCFQRHCGTHPLYDVVGLGYNYRLDEIRAALGLVQLGKLRRNNARRAVLTAHYRRRLDGFKGATMPFAHARGEPVHHILPVLVDEDVDRAACVEALHAQGIQTSVHYTPVHQFQYYRERYGFAKGMLPKTEAIGARELTLPLHPLLTEAVVDEIVDALDGAYDRARRVQAGNACD